VGVIVTGFDPFHGAPFNPSSVVASRVRGAQSFILPTCYDRAEARIVELIETHQPDLVIMLGLHEKTDQPLLERFAVNIDDSATPDNDGVVRQGISIKDTGPQAWRTSLDLEALTKSATEEGFEVGISNHAGAFVCNHTYYCALEAAPSATACLFIHIPPADPEDTESLDELARLVEIIIAS